MVLAVVMGASSRVNWVAILWLAGCGGPAVINTPPPPRPARRTPRPPPRPRRVRGAAAGPGGPLWGWRPGGGAPVESWRGRPSTRVVAAFDGPGFWGRPPDPLPRGRARF